jgi:hypothetical protein
MKITIPFWKIAFELRKANLGEIYKPKEIASKCFIRLERK